MSKEEKTPETKAEEYVETEFVKEMAVEPVEVPDVTYEGELIGWAEHTPHEHEHHEHHKEDPEELVETEFVKEMAGEPGEVPDVTYEGEIVGWTEHMPHHEGEHHEHHEHHKEDTEELVETEFVKEMAVEPVEVPDVTYEGEIVGWTEHMPHHEHTEEKK